MCKKWKTLLNTNKYTVESLYQIFTLNFVHQNGMMAKLQSYAYYP